MLSIKFLLGIQVKHSLKFAPFYYLKLDKLNIVNFCYDYFVCYFLLIFY